MSKDKKTQNQDQNKKEQINTPNPPQRMDPRKEMKEQDKGDKDRNKGK